ncbi:MAG: DegT/DnrJ/EryC1/StrS family aminotransferase [candidate division Zixibacteria bacterium]|nr:DegT/DnrJ/EryC1/StrS family aminotransferase [candidate division Zixibacteria bacterium]
MAVPLLDLKRQYAYLKEEMDAAISEVFNTELFILGPQVTEFEQKIAEYCHTKYAVAVASGTDALLLSLRACDVGRGDEVITSDFSFFASAGVVSHLGASPVFVDIEPDSYNINPELLEKAITPKTKAIVPVHLFGQMADMDPIMQIAKKHNLKVVEDAAQSIGAEYKSKLSGSIGDLGCFSFFPSKNLGGSGDGGMIVTNSEELYEKCVMLRTHGEKPKYYHRIVGYNSRLDTLQAATLLVKLPYLRKWSEKRIEHAKRYDEAFKNVEAVTTPKVMDYNTFHIYNQYTLASPKREKIMAGLKEAEIGHAIYYPVPFHKQDCFSDLGCKPEDFAVSSDVTGQVFSIPVYPELTDDEQSQVIETIKKLAS